MSKTTEPDLVTEVEDLLAKATPGPWVVYPDSRPDIVTEAKVNSGYMGERHLLSLDKYGEPWGQKYNNEDDANLIAAAPELLRRLVEEVKTLRTQVLQLRQRERKQLVTVIEIRGCDKCDLCEDHA